MLLEMLFPLGPQLGQELLHPARRNLVDSFELAGLDDSPNLLNRLVGVSGHGVRTAANDSSGDGTRLLAHRLGQPAPDNGPCGTVGDRTGDLTKYRGGRWFPFCKTRSRSTAATCRDVLRQLSVPGRHVLGRATLPAAAAVPDAGGQRRRSLRAIASTSGFFLGTMAVSLPLAVAGAGAKWPSVRATAAVASLFCGLWFAAVGVAMMKALVMRIKRITFWRRIVQTACFVVILYGVFLWEKPVATPLPKIDPGTPRTSLYPAGPRPVGIGGRYGRRSVSAYAGLPLHRQRRSVQGVRPPLVEREPDLAERSQEGRSAPFPVLALVVLFARYWCGWICPLGAITDFLNGLRKTLRIPGWQVGPKTDTFFRGMRHFLLWASLAISLLIALPWFGLKGVNDSLFLVYCQVCPARIVYPVLGGISPCLYDTNDAHDDLPDGAQRRILALLPGRLLRAASVVPRVRDRGPGFLFQPRRRGVAQEESQPSVLSAEPVAAAVPWISRWSTASGRSLTSPTRHACICLRCVEECPEKRGLQAKLLGRTVAES